MLPDAGEAFEAGEAKLPERRGVGVKNRCRPGFGAGAGVWGTASMAKLRATPATTLEPPLHQMLRVRRSAPHHSGTTKVTTPWW